MGPPACLETETQRDGATGIPGDGDPVLGLGNMWDEPLGRSMASLGVLRSWNDTQGAKISTHSRQTLRSGPRRKAHRYCL